MKGNCQLQAKVCAQSTVKFAQEKVWLGELDHHDMTRADDWDVKHQAKQNVLEQDTLSSA